MTQQQQQQQRGWGLGRSVQAASRWAQAHCSLLLLLAEGCLGQICRLSQALLLLLLLLGVVSSTRSQCMRACHPCSSCLWMSML